jgi:nitrite reductase/ring-hydroxylating ferredoxin subunit
MPERQARGFDLEGVGRDRVFVVRKRGSLYGYRNACPHWDGAPMAWRQDAYLSADGSCIVCHAHGAKFVIETGLCVAGPCIGQSLAPVALEVRAGGVYLMSEVKE